MNRRRLISRIVLTASVLLSVAVVLLFTLDLGFLRGTVEDRVRQATGRDFTIQQAFSVRLGRELVISAEDIRLGNPEWAGTGDLLGIGKLAAVIDPVTLWRGPVLIRQLELDDLDLQLLQDDEGRSNWELAEAGAPAEDAEGLPFLVESLALTNLDAGFDSPKLDQAIAAQIETLLQRVEADGRVHIDLGGTLSGRPVTVTAEAGPYENLLSGESIEVRGSGQFGNIAVSGEAEIDNLWSPRTPVFELEVSGPELEELTGMLGIEGLAGGALSFSAKSRLAENQLAIDVAGQFGELELDFKSEVASLHETSGASFDAHVKGPNFGRIARLAGFEGWPEEAFDIRTLMNRPDDGLRIERFTLSLAGASIGLLGDIPDFPDTSGAQLKLQISGQDLSRFREVIGMKDLPTGYFNVHGDVSTGTDGATGVDVRFELPLVSGSLAGRMGGEDLKGLDVRFTAQGDSITKVGSILDLPELAKGPWSASAGISVTDPAFIDVTDGAFHLEGVEVALAGRVGAESLKANSNLSVEARGADITRVLPELAGIAFDVQDFEFVADVAWRDGQVSIAEGTARIGETTLSAEGTIDPPPNLSATNLAFNIQAPDLSRLGTIDGERWEAVPLNLRSVFTGTTTKFLMEQFQAHVGESAVRGNFAIDFEPEVPRFDLSLAADDLDLRPFQPEPVETAEGDEPGDERMIPALAFPMEALALADGRFSIKAGRVLLKKMTLGNGSLTGTVQDGVLRIDEMGTDGYQGRLVSGLTLGPGVDGMPHLTTTVNSEGLIINLSGRSEQEKSVLPAFDIAVELDGAGHDLREAAAALNGSIRITSQGGQVRNARSESAAALFLSEVISAISPSEGKKDVINISCIAADFTVQQGMLGLDPGLAIQSDKLNISAGGKINLDSESIDVNFRTETRKAANVSASELISPYVKLSGTLASPKVALDPKGTLLSGGAAYLSGGLSILAKKALGQIKGTRDPCADLLKKAAKDQ